MDNKEIFDLLNKQIVLLESLNIYKKTKSIYLRSKIALGLSASFNLTVSNTQEIEVHNGAQYSTKIYSGK